MKISPRTSYEAYGREEVAEQERQDEALRRFYARERQPVHVTGKTLWHFFLWCCAIAGGIGAFVWWRGAW